MYMYIHLTIYVQIAFYIFLSIFYTLYTHSIYLFKSVDAQRDNVSNIATVSIRDERQSTPSTTMDHLGVLSGWIIELPINYGKKFVTEERRNFYRATVSRREYLE